MSGMLPRAAGVRNTDANDHAALDGYELTPADADFDLVALGAVKAPVVIRGLSFGGSGTLKVTMVGGGVLTFNDGDLLAGMIHPMSVKRVWLTGTSVARIKVWW